MKNVLLLIFLSFLASECLTQNAVVFGRVTSSESKLSMMNVKVSCDLCSNVVLTDINGEYSLDIPAGKATKINYDKEGYQAISYDLEPISQDGKRYINIYLAEDNQKIEVVIRASKIDDGGMVREKVTEFKVLPTASGNFESVLPSIALGVNAGSGGELSSQYNVRGGNYDENLVYINDFEIFRPQLIRASQQEGLSFPNIDLIRDIKFSSGGYDATYGNKMSSVLDIKYKRPDQFRSSISGSLLGLNGHIEGSKRLGSNAYNKFRYLIGARYKTNAYLLGTQDVKGEYIPDFIDVQAYLTYDISRSLQLAYLGNYNSSVFNFLPLTRNTTLGLLTNAIRLSTAYEGGEKDKFLHGLNGLSFNFVPDRKEIPYFIKVMASRYSGSEAENFDILGYYRLAQIDTDQNSSTFNQELSLLGTGVQHRYARNYLYNEIYNGEIKTGIEIAKNNKTHFIEAGLKYQTEIFEDYINEWERLDSAGYSLPYTGKEVAINKVLKTSNDINNQKLDFFVQDKLTISKERYKLNLTGGIRYTNIAFTKENLISPRVAIDYFPSTSSNISYRLAAGRYYQASFYREFRLIGGGINQDAKSQESIHLVGGINYDFMWKSRSRKPFKLLSEIYYKKMSNLISYDVDNVRIAYSGKNDSKGYATGIDFRINGEFVPDAESWVNVGFLRTRESIEGVTHKTRRDTAFYTIADVPRSTDRFFNINLFFQDYLPKNKNFKANVAYSYASGLPFGIKDNNIIARNIFRYKPYQRLDIGFSYMLFDKSMSRAISPNNPFRNTEKTWISLEVFNIMNYTNTASITWIKTITNDQYAINNYLTGRRVNLRFRIDF